ncbi:hypothetical protein KUTeg_011202 [Tegillarca granosa]|uniref:Uncharacterized protein n=1 Tax=Tegillarca granosa TaxID=220873 RepID=A0ABQ9F4U7_TEGGR|nr:hypothetical protein KUTeg_011202 [Tegillarca granosa]
MTESVFEDTSDPPESYFSKKLIVPGAGFHCPVDGATCSVSLECLEPAELNVVVGYPLGEDVEIKLAACQLKCDSFEYVITNCSKALGINPKAVKGLVRRGQAYLGQHNTDKALTDLRNALKLEPHNKYKKTVNKNSSDSVKGEMEETTSEICKIEYYPFFTEYVVGCVHTSIKCHMRLVTATSFILRNVNNTNHQMFPPIIDTYKRYKKTCPIIKVLLPGGVFKWQKNHPRKTLLTQVKGEEEKQQNGKKQICPPSDDMKIFMKLIQMLKTLMMPLEIRQTVKDREDKDYKKANVEHGLVNAQTNAGMLMTKLI